MSEYFCNYHPYCHFRWAPLWKVSNIASDCHFRLNSDHVLKPSGEGEVERGLGERLEGRSLPARLLGGRDLAEHLQGQDGQIQGLFRQLPFRRSWRSPLLTRRGCLLTQVIVAKFVWLAPYLFHIFTTLDALSMICGSSFPPFSSRAEETCSSP